MTGVNIERHDHLLVDHWRRLRRHGVQRCEFQSEGTTGPDEGRVHTPGISQLFSDRPDRGEGPRHPCAGAAGRSAEGEFAYFGFGITLVSASIAHYSVGDPALFVIDPLLFLSALIASYALFLNRRRDQMATGRVLRKTA